MSCRHPGPGHRKGCGISNGLLQWVGRRPAIPLVPLAGRVFTVVSIFMAPACPVAAAATAAEAQALSERAAAYILEVGEEKAFADFARKDGGFVDGELYVFCYDRDGVNKAHGGNPALVGRNLLHIKDPDGTEPNLLIVKMGFEQGRGWVDFKWPNPVSKTIEDKSAYVIRTGDVACGVGYYKG